MSIVKIQGVNRLKESIDYISQNSKTNGDLISTYDCDEEVILDDFRNLYKKRKELLRKETNNKAKMIIQSFDFRDNISEKEAHEIGVKLADNYLKGNHQYIVATHTDTDYLHNHIIFNEVRSDNLLMFDTSRRNTIDNLRIENDKLSREYNLHIPKERSHDEKIKYISQREIKAREKGTSFKEEIENVIDSVIKESENYDEFINIMEDLGYESKSGRHLAFLNKNSDYFMRTKTLGMNYTENSIKYRIKNKNFKIHKFKYTVKSERIDTSQQKFKKNRGLRKWASRKNIAHLQEISNLVINEDISLEEVNETIETEKEFTDYVDNEVNNKDSILYDLEKKSTAFRDYKNSTELIMDYKSSDNKVEFKRSNYDDFKKYDTAKRNMHLLKKDYGITNQEKLFNYYDEIMEERNELFSKYTELFKLQNNDKTINKTNEQEKEIEGKEIEEKEINEQKEREHKRNKNRGLRR